MIATPRVSAGQRWLRWALPLLALPSAAWAWTPLRAESGQVLSWPAGAWPLAFRPTALADHRAAAAWTVAGPARWLPSGPWAGALLPEPDLAEVPAPDALADLAPDGVTAVVAVDAAEDWAALVGDPALVGFALVTHREGVLVDVDVVLNTARFVVEAAPDPAHYLRRTVVQHELGHALGLGHSCGEAEGPRCDGVDPAGLAAAMYPRIGPGDARPLGADDQAGLAAVVTAAPTHPEPLVLVETRPIAGTLGAAAEVFGLGSEVRLALWGVGAPAPLLAYETQPGGAEAGAGSVLLLAAGQPAFATRWSVDGRGGEFSWPTATGGSDAGMAGADASAADAFAGADAPDGGAADAGSDDFSGAKGGGCAQSGLNAGAGLTALPFCLTLFGLPLALRRARQGEFGT